MTGGAGLHEWLRTRTDGDGTYPYRSRGSMTLLRFIILWPLGSFHRSQRVAHGMAWRWRSTAFLRRVSGAISHVEGRSRHVERWKRYSRRLSLLRCFGCHVSIGSSARVGETRQPMGNHFRPTRIRKIVALSSVPILTHRLCVS